MFIRPSEGVGTPGGRLTNINSPNIATSLLGGGVF